MNLTTLQYLIAVYEEKNMTKAAIKLFIAQPTLSQSIRTLEEELGVVLFDRNKTPLVATDAGEFVIQWARQLLTSEQYLRDRLNEISKKHKQTFDDWHFYTQNSASSPRGNPQLLFLPRLLTRHPQREYFERTWLYAGSRND